MLDRGFCTPLHLYCSGSIGAAGLPFLELLVNANENAQIAKDSTGHTPLDRACQWPSARVIRFLAERCPEVLEPEWEGSTGTPLHTLCASGSSLLRSFLECLSILAMSKRAVRARDYGGRTPLHWLCFAGGLTRDALRVLLKRCPDLLLERDIQGRLPFHLAVDGYDDSDDVKALRHHETIQCLVAEFSCRRSCWGQVQTDTTSACMWEGYKP